MNESSIIEDLPDFVTELCDNDEVQALLEDSDDTDRIIAGKHSHTTCGSWENDRVLHMIPFLVFEFEDMGYGTWLVERK